MITANEQSVLTHDMRWGSDGYPIRRDGRKWFVDGAFGVGASPESFKTKKAASAQWEKTLDILRDKKAGRM